MSLELVKDQVTLTVTKEGAAVKHNSWKEGQTIKCSNALAEKFIKAGYCEPGGSAKATKKKDS
jgi:hypothetical protein